MEHYSVEDRSPPPFDDKKESPRNLWDSDAQDQATGA